MFAYFLSLPYFFVSGLVLPINNCGSLHRAKKKKRSNLLTFFANIFRNQINLGWIHVSFFSFVKNRESIPYAFSMSVKPI